MDRRDRSLAAFILAVLCSAIGGQGVLAQSIYCTPDGGARTWDSVTNLPGSVPILDVGVLQRCRHQLEYRERAARAAAGQRSIPTVPSLHLGDTDAGGPGRFLYTGGGQRAAEGLRSFGQSLEELGMMQWMAAHRSGRASYIRGYVQATHDADQRIGNLLSRDSISFRARGWQVPACDPADPLMCLWGNELLASGHVVTIRADVDVWTDSMRAEALRLMPSWRAGVAASDSLPRVPCLVRVSALAGQAQVVGQEHAIGDTARATHGAAMEARCCGG
jgi:hypothetical protein